MVERGRSLRGERNKRAKLERREVAEMRAMRQGGSRLKELAAAYGVTVATVSRAVSGVSWREANASQTPQTTEAQGGE